MTYRYDQPAPKPPSWVPGVLTDRQRRAEIEWVKTLANDLSEGSGHYGATLESIKSHLGVLIKENAQLTGRGRSRA